MSNKYTWWKTLEGVYTMGVDKFYIAFQNGKGGYGYAALNSPNQYIYDHIIRVDKNARLKTKQHIRYHEVMPEWGKRRLYFDIDYVNSKKYVMNVNMFLGNLLTSIKYEIVRNNLTYNPANIFILQSTATDKISYHVTITGIYVDNCYHAKEFFQRVSEYMQSLMTKEDMIFMEALDNKVYSLNHQMRIAGSVKLNAKHVHKLFEFGPISYPTFNSPADCIEYTLSNTLIQNVQVDDELLNYGHVTKKSPYIYDEEMTSSVYEAVIRMVSAVLPDEMMYSDGVTAFEVRKVTGGTIEFMRLMPSFCISCKRTHDSVGFSIHVTKTNMAYMWCFGGSKSMELGNYKNEKFEKAELKFFSRKKGVLNHGKLQITGNEMISHLISKYGILISE